MQILIGVLHSSPNTGLSRVWTDQHCVTGEKCAMEELKAKGPKESFHVDLGYFMPYLGFLAASDLSMCGVILEGCHFTGSVP